MVSFGVMSARRPTRRMQFSVVVEEFVAASDEADGLALSISFRAVIGKIFGGL